MITRFTTNPFNLKIKKKTLNKKIPKEFLINEAAYSFIFTIL